jgi:hypothetical protein
VIRHQYQRAEIPQSKLYMIDKVVRMRGLHGRFGIDHSELLNFEIDQTNRNRDDHMNWLVYKNNYETQAEEDLSVVLRQKLNILQEEIDTIGTEHYVKNQNADKQEESTAKLSYKEWLKHKDAESRLKRKLINQA